MLFGKIKRIVRLVRLVDRLRERVVVPQLRAVLLVVIVMIVVVMVFETVSLFPHLINIIKQVDHNTES
jgi:predicted PurR-regulated permease PerM